ncbi:hypothetical protein [Ornithinimicrobium cavernae]|uniref:hypothetical protein n=1 Tax=Ornithinimicrobium cavernae TaxID=2666047 RepID=UPI000D69D465|nr:hypothetical protein [Ornithinimicrobium cavernae]
MAQDRQTLERWEEFGGVWRVVAADDRAATVSMCRCDGGEEVQRLTTEDPDLVAWLVEHPESG